MRPKRLLFLTHYDLQATPYGDIVLPMLFEDGWDINVVAPNASRSILRKVWPYACRTYDCGEGRRKDWQLLCALVRGRLTGGQVLYLHSQSAAVTAGLAVAGCRKLVYHTPDYYDPLRFPMRSRLEGLVARAANLYIDNEFHRAYVARALHGLRGRILTVPPNLPAAWPIPPKDAAVRARMTGGRDGAFVLMLHGGYSRNRMTDELLQALAALPDDFRLVMTCDSAVVKQRLEELDLGDRVIRLPYGDYHSMLRYSVNADAGVLLYCNNDLGNFFTAPGRLTEYLACGLPVIASDHTGLESLVLKFGLGASVNAAEPASIAAGLLRLRDLISGGALPSEHCRAQFLRHFAVDHWKTAICESFNAVLTDGRHRGAAPPPWPWMPTANAD